VSATVKEAEATAAEEAKAASAADEEPRLRRPCLPWPRRLRPLRLEEAEAVSARGDEGCVRRGRSGGGIGGQGGRVYCWRGSGDPGNEKAAAPRRRRPCQSSAAE